jgi:hypothetical protein
MQCEIRVITPDDARKLLGSNTINRPLRKGHVDFFESQLQRGEMQLTHQGIAISENGRVLDGQHRLTAIANTGIATTMLVAYGLPESSFSVLDTGAARKASDALSIDGACNAHCMAAGIRLWLFYQNLRGQLWGGVPAVKIYSVTAVKAQYELDPEGWDWAGKTATAFCVPKLLTPGPSAAFLYLAFTDGYSQKYLAGFMRCIKEGADLTYGNPILAFRNKEFSGVGAGTKKQQARVADLIKLFNAYTTGQQLKIFKSQQFPPMPSLVHASESIHEDAMSSFRQ